jgi:hypothetical protein
MISPALREKASVSMSATPNVSRRGEGWGAILLPSRFSGGGLFFMLGECRTWDTVPSQGRSWSSSPKWPSGHIWKDQKFDPETTRVMGLAFEMARVALRQFDGARPTDEAIAKNIIELALAGERDADVLCDRTARRSISVDDSAQR